MSGRGKPTPMRPLPGGNIDQLQVVGRESAIAAIYELAAAGADQLLADPRRMGKTVTMKQLRRTPVEGWDVSFADFQGINSVEDFIARAFEQIRDHGKLSSKAWSAIKGFFNDTTLTAGSDKLLQLAKTFEADPVATFERAILNLDKQFVEEGRHLLLCWDEIPDLVELIHKNPNEPDRRAAALLQTFRRVRQQTRAIRWVVAGSVGFHHIRRGIGAGVDVVNDMHGIPFGPLATPDAIWLAHSLLLYVTTSDQSDVAAVAETLAKRSGNIPYLIHAIADQLLQEQPDSIDADAVEAAFSRYIQDATRSDAATHFLVRIEEYYGDNADLARRILDHIAADATISFKAIADHFIADTCSRDQLLDVVDLLKLDHYVHESVDNEFTWRYPVLGDIWHRRRRTP